MEALMAKLGQSSSSDQDLFVCLDMRRLTDRYATLLVFS